MSDHRPLVWISGMRGFLGRNVALRFSQAGWRLAGVGITGPNDALPSSLLNAPKGPIWVEGAVSISALETLLALSGPPDVFVHAAGSGTVGLSMTDPWQDFRNAVETTAAALETLRRHAPTAKFVFPSSAAVYGNQTHVPLKETDALEPISPYGAHKVAAEWLCRSASLTFDQPTRIVRFFSLYGPGLKKQLLWDIVQRLKTDPAELQLFGSGNETRDLLFVEDAAELIFHLATKTPGSFLIVNGASGVPVTVRSIVEQIVTALGTRTKLRFEGATRPGDPEHLEADVSSLRNIGFKSKYSLADGIEHYIAWCRDSGFAY